MTVIVALRQHGETWIGADGLVSASNGDRYPGSVRKWNLGSDGRYAIASAGHSVTRTALAKIFDVTAILSGLELSGVLRAIMKENDLEKDHDKRWPNEFIAVMPEGVFDVSSDLSVHPIPDGTLWARGSGENYAIGAGYALGKFQAVSSEQRVIEAVNAACEFNKGCGGQHFIHRLGDPLPG